MRKLSLVLVGVLLLSCKPKPQPPGGGDTVSVDSGKVDTTAAESSGVSLDSSNYEEFPPEPDLTPADTVIPDSAPRRSLRQPRAPTSQGRAFGFSTIPQDEWCYGDVNATIGAGNPTYLANTIKKAYLCNMGVYWTIPRSMMTTNGENQGPFSLTRAKTAVDKIARVVNPLVAEYGSAMLGMSLLDDWKCLPCWGGSEIPVSQIVELVKYADSKVNQGIPLGLRGEATFLKGAQFNGTLDYNVDQWHKKKGPKNAATLQEKQLSWYRDQATAGKALGIPRAIYSVNVGDLNGGDPGVELASPSELTTHGSIAVQFDPADQPSCGVLNWKWDRQFKTSNYNTAIDALAFKASQQTRRKCST